MHKQFNILPNKTKFYYNGHECLKRPCAHYNAIDCMTGELLHINTGELVRLNMRARENRALWLLYL